MSKRGVSDVVTIVLIILLALAAILALWYFIRPAISNTGTSIDDMEFCLENKLVPLSCTKITNSTDEGYNVAYTALLSSSAERVNQTSITLIFADGTTGTINAVGDLYAGDSRSVAIASNNRNATRAKLTGTFIVKSGASKSCESVEVECTDQTQNNQLPLYTGSFGQLGGSTGTGGSNSGASNGPTVYTVSDVSSFSASIFNGCMGLFGGSLGESLTYKAYAYRSINGQRVYSANPKVSTISLMNTGGICVSLNINVPNDANGVRVIRVTPGDSMTGSPDSYAGADFIANETYLDGEENGLDIFSSNQIATTPTSPLTI